MNRWLSALLVLTLLLSYPLASVMAAEPPHGEMVELRGQTSKTHYLGNGQYATQARLGPAHYQGPLGDWQEIDNAWVPGTAPWNWQMVEDDYKAYALSSFTSGQVLKFERDGSTVAFQPKDLQWTNNLDMIQSISIPHNVPVALNNTPVELLSGMEGSLGTIRWDNAYGSGRHFEWATTPGMLQTLLQLDAEPPAPAEYIITGGDPVLRLSFIFDPSSDLTIYVNGSLWDKSTTVQTVQDIEFRSGEEAVWYFRQAKYWDSSEAGITPAATTKLRKVGNALWLDVLVPYDWLQTAEYPVFIDPDTGATYPGIGESVDRGATDWSNPTYIETEANAATCAVPLSGYSDWLRAKNFGFAVPTGASIVGIKAEVNRSAGIPDYIRDYSLRLVDAAGSPVGTDKASATYWPTTAATATYGGATDTWTASPTPAMVNDADFGIQLYVRNINTIGAITAYVYWVKITVYYTDRPTTTILPATSITTDSARINAEVLNDGGAACEGRFSWGKIELEDDFEWGVDTDPLSDDGGDIDWTVVVAGTSVAEIETTDPYGGTRCARLYHDGANVPRVFFTQPALTSNEVIEMGLKQGSGASLLFLHGNGTKRIYVRLYLGTVQYFSTALVDTEVPVVADTWYLLSIRNVNWDDGTYDIYWENDLIANAVMNVNTGNANVWDLRNQSGSSEAWFDNARVLANRTTTAFANGLTTDDPFFADLTSLTSGARHVYQAQLQNSAGEGAWSDEECFSTVSIDVDETTYDFGTILPNTTSTTGLDYFTVTNTGGVTVDITIQGTDATGGADTWTLADNGSPGENIYALYAGLAGGDYTIIVKKSAPYNTLVSDLAATETQKWGLKLWMPTSLDGYQNNELAATITLVGSASS